MTPLMNYTRDEFDAEIRPTISIWIDDQEIERRLRVPPYIMEDHVISYLMTACHPEMTVDELQDAARLAIQRAIRATNGHGLVVSAVDLRMAINTLTAVMFVRLRQLGCFPDREPVG
jgi:pyridoxine 5'-phosphate synthase PdxJ